MKKYWFNAFALWGLNAFPQAIEDVLHEAYPDWLLTGRDIALDNWLRGVLELSDEQASRLRKTVDAWNESSPNGIVFILATGAEYMIDMHSSNGSLSESWRRGA